MVHRRQHNLFLTLLVLGVYSQLSQAMLIRECLVVFYGNEVTLGAFYGSWLFWIAVGSALVVYWRERDWVRQPLPVLSGTLLLLPLVLAGQILVTRGVRLLLDVSPTELIPLGQVFVAIALVVAPAGILIGLAFPLAARGLRPDRQADQDLPGTLGAVSGLYIFEAIGALLGGLLFTFVFVEWLGTWRTLGVVALLLGLTAWPLGSGGWRRLGLALVLTMGLALGFTPLSSWLEPRLEALRFATLQPALQWVDAVETRYGHLALGRTGDQFSLVADGRIGESFPAQREADQEAAYVYSQAEAPKRLLLFGGSAGGLVEALLRYPVERIDLIEQDQLAFERMRPHLPEATQAALKDPRVRLVFMDGRRFLKEPREPSPYDLVLVLRDDPSSAHGNRYFTLEFYRRIQHLMTPEGVFCTAVSSASNYLGREVKSYSASVYHSLKPVWPFIAIAPGDQHLYCAAALAERVTEDAWELSRRYLVVPLDEHRFPATSFHNLLDPGRIAYVRSQLEQEEAEINTDARPLTYYLNMLLWGKFTASALVTWLESARALGPWPYLVPLGVMVWLLMLKSALAGAPRRRTRRWAAILALAVQGLIAMAVQLCLLFAYQAHLGFVFSRIALLNGLFMTGLVIGAGVFGRSLPRRRRPGLALIGLMLVIAAGCAALPTGFEFLDGLGAGAQEAVYLGLCGLAGLVTGAGFPLGVHLAHLDTEETVHSSGLIEAADSLGGALGGLLTGALMVPLLGVAGTAWVLAMMALLVCVPLLFAEYAPERLPALVARGGRAFPYQGLSWGLGFLVLTSFVLMLLNRAAQPGPQLHFDDVTLARLSGSASFELRERPFPHYLGQGGEAGETVSLATRAVAGDIRGYAGPIDLLVSFDRQGRLRGVRYLGSNETPAYVAGIDTWLERLAGHSLTEPPLSLQRLDGLGGATVSSRAALETINQAARLAGREVFGSSFAPRTQVEATPAWLSPGFLTSLVLLLGFFPVYLSGSERARLVFQGASLLVLGLWLNTLVTEIDLLNLSQGRLSDLATNPLRWLLLGFVGLTAILFGQVWCGYVCPFGALQEFISRLGRWLRLRTYPERPLETRVRYLKFLLLALLLLGVWLGGEESWAGFNPMQHFFGGHWRGWMGAIIALSLLGALFYYRFWCRYFCPFGAFVALSNKIALLHRLAPKRRIEHCDLGVQEELDIDCIHCNRCLTAKDTRLRPRIPSEPSLGQEHPVTPPEAYTPRP